MTSGALPAARHTLRTRAIALWARVQSCQPSGRVQRAAATTCTQVCVCMCVYVPESTPRESMFTPTATPFEVPFATCSPYFCVADMVYTQYQLSCASAQERCLYSRKNPCRSGQMWRKNDAAPCLKRSSRLEESLKSMLELILPHLCSHQTNKTRKKAEQGRILDLNLSKVK